MTEASPGHKVEQARRRWGLADLISVSRLPLAALFVLAPNTSVRLGILAAAALTDLLDGWLARRLGPSRMGTFIDPVADRLFMASAFAMVALSGALSWLEVVAVLARDIVASVAFFTTAFLGRPAAIPARASGKVVTVLQVATLLAWLLGGRGLRLLAWTTAAAGLYAIRDYYRMRAERRPV